VRAALGDGVGEWLFSAALYALGLPLTVAIALLSYFGFERRFLRLKLRFSRIVTGDLATRSGEESGEEFSLESAPVTSVDKLG